MGFDLIYLTRMRGSFILGASILEECGKRNFFPGRYDRNWRKYHTDRYGQIGTFGVNIHVSISN